jgi:hypothetical protein
MRIVSIKKHSSLYTAIQRPLTNIKAQTIKKQLHI